MSIIIVIVTVIAVWREDTKLIIVFLLPPLRYTLIPVSNALTNRLGDTFTFFGLFQGYRNASASKIPNVSKMDNRIRTVLKGTGSLLIKSYIMWIAEGTMIISGQYMKTEKNTHAKTKSPYRLKNGLNDPSIDHILDSTIVSQDKQAGK